MHDIDGTQRRIADLQGGERMNCGNCPESKLVLKEDGPAEMVMDPDSETCRDCMDEQIIQDMKHLKDEMIRFCDMHAHDIQKDTYDVLCGAIYRLWSELDDREVE